MLNCWKINSVERPTFKSIYEMLSSTKKKSEDESWSKYPSMN